MPRTASLAMLLAAVALSACATGPRGGPGERQEAAAETVVPEALIFLEFDANRDRVITDAELRAGLDADWAQASKGAASIGHIELREWLVTVLGSDAFDFGPVGFDTNYDATVTKAEFTNAFSNRFANLDANKDGSLSRKELVRQSLGRGFPGQTPGQQGGPPGGGQGGGRGGPPGR
jgi:hypothetical protein